MRDFMVTMAMTYPCGYCADTTVGMVDAWHLRAIFYCHFYCGHFNFVFVELI
jgi:hypothetical protein